MAPEFAIPDGYHFVSVEALLCAYFLEEEESLIFSKELAKAFSVLWRPDWQKSIERLKAEQGTPAC